MWVSVVVWGVWWCGGVMVWVVWESAMVRGNDVVGECGGVESVVGVGECDDVDECGGFCQETKVETSFFININQSIKIRMNLPMNLIL